jgi:ectoine hydroxylase-related dioxygenase (phytanoyl-CoA dioxygenase family)
MTGYGFASPAGRSIQPLDSMPLHQALDENGYAIAPSVTGPVEVSSIESALLEMPITGAGTRNLLELEWCRNAVARLRAAPILRGVLPAQSVAVQCTLFDKTPDQNWLVALHQDLSIPVSDRVAHPALGAWSVKEGRNFVQPPAELLAQLVAVRVHIDECGPENGPLRVVPGSHREGRLTAPAARQLRDRAGEVACTVGRGDALILKPLILHASSKAQSPNHRRVLHFLFGPASIGYGLRWQHAV